MSSRDRSALEELGVTSAERTRLRRALDALEPDDEARVDPPAEIWAGISAALNDDGVPTTGAAHPGDGAGTTGTTVVRLGERRARRRHQAWVVGAVAAAAVLIAGIALALRDGSSSGDGTELVAAATLQPLGPVGEASADVELVRTDDHLELVLEARDMTPAPAGRHYELWLLDPSNPSAEPVSLGPMTGPTEAPVPDGVDPDEYDVVDISLQEAGQEEHSGNSLLRGTLT